MNKFFLCQFVSLSVCFGATSTGQEVERLHPLSSPDQSNCYFFGYNTANADGWLVSGTYTCSGAGQSGGGMLAAYERTGAGYQLRQVLNSSSVLVGQLGEYGIDLSMPVLVASNRFWYASVGTPVGKAHVFELMGTSWVQTGELTNPNPLPQQGYSSAVATNGDTVFVHMVGWPVTNGNLGTAGAIFIYKKLQGVWTQVQLYSPPDTPEFFLAWAGRGMAVSGSTLVWGSSSIDKLFVLEEDSNGVWGLVQTIPNATPLGGGRVWEIEIDGDSLAVGVNNDQFNTPGRVYIYKRVNGTWVYDTMIQAHDNAGGGDGYGFDLDLRGDLLAVGAPRSGAFPGPTGPGAVYVYERDLNGAWNFKYKLINADGEQWEQLGASVSIGDDYVLVGDPAEVHQLGVAPGAAFVFELPMGESVCPGNANSTGFGSELEVYGTGQAATNWTRLSVTGLPPSQAGLFLAARSPGWIPFPGGSQGHLCLGGTIYRLNTPGQWGLSNAQGGRELQLNTGILMETYGPPVLAGESWTFQFWHRDHNPTSTSNFSSAVEVQFR